MTEDEVTAEIDKLMKEEVKAASRLVAAMKKMLESSSG